MDLIIIALACNLQKPEAKGLPVNQGDSDAHRDWQPEYKRVSGLKT
jgi:hypothetical protein